MFTIPEEITRIHRSIEKLPRLQQFMTSIERGSINHNKSYKTALAYLEQFVVSNYSGLNIDTLIDSINSGVDVYKFLDGFVSFLETKKLSKASINRYTNCAKSYLQYSDVDIIPYKFKKRVKLPRVSQEDPQAIDQNDIRTILNQCHNRRLKTYLLILASSGVRPIEACAIRVCDIDFNSRPVQLHIRAEYTKTKRSRYIFISDEAGHWLREWVEHKFGIVLNKNNKIDTRIRECLVFQVYSFDICNITPQSIYQKLVQQFHKVLGAVDFDQRRDGMPQRRKITLHSFRRFVKTTISDLGLSDYSEWFLGHKKSSYYQRKQQARAEIYLDRCMKYLTFLDYSALEAAGKTVEARMTEFEKEKEIINQKHEAEIKTVHEQMNRILEMIAYDPRFARVKRTALTRLANSD